MGTSTLQRVAYVGHERIYLHQREGSKKPYGLRFAGGKIAWYASDSARERIINKRATENNQGKRKYQARIKEIICVCECGCGETFTSPFKTRKPRYKDAEHQARARADRRAAKRAEQKKLAAKSKSKGAKKTAQARKTEETRSRSRAGGVEDGGAGEGEGASPSPRVRRNKGLFADTPEPQRTKKRANLGLPTEE
jgi:FKBP-type peptidyl-prolyl cis-trans isomerase